MNKKDKKALQYIFRKRFDSRNCYESEAEIIIDLARKWKLSKDFIKELVTDFNEYFKS